MEDLPFTYITDFKDIDIFNEMATFDIEAPVGFGNIECIDSSFDENNDYYQKNIVKEINDEPKNRNVPAVINTGMGLPKVEGIMNNFQFDVKVVSPGKYSKYLYAPKLNTAYLDMNVPLPVEFTCGHVGNDKLIRATLIFSAAEQRENRVIRCPNHSNPTDALNKGISQDILHHILRSNSTTDDIIYRGDINDNQAWPSVAFRINNSKKVNSFRHVYTFCCQHSCRKGIERRQIEVLFTLEDLNGNIYGCKSIGVRICACPKRDMRKDLGLEDKQLIKTSKKRKNTNELCKNNGKRPLKSDSDIHALEIPIFKKSNLKHILRTSYDMMASEIVKHPNDNDVKKKAEECMAEISYIYQEQFGESVNEN